MDLKRAIEIVTGRSQDPKPDLEKPAGPVTEKIEKIETELDKKGQESKPLGKKS